MSCCPWFLHINRHALLFDGIMLSFEIYFFVHGFICFCVCCTLDNRAGASAALEHRADCVVAMGGAAVMDAAKVVAAIAYADKDHKKAARRLLEAADKPRYACRSCKTCLYFCDACLCVLA